MQQQNSFKDSIQAFVDACYRATMWAVLVAAWGGVALLGVSVFVCPEVSVVWKVMSVPGFFAIMLMLTSPFLICLNDLRRPIALTQLVCACVGAMVAAAYVSVGFYLLCSDMDWLWKFVIASVWVPTLLVVGALWFASPQARGEDIPAALMRTGRMARGIFILSVTYENEAVCKVCGGEMTEHKVFCCRCYTPHHRECWTFSGKCAVYACGERHFFVPKEVERLKKELERAKRP
jgi:hypothetical protein